jgi:type IV pilus assembly protein PilV
MARHRLRVKNEGFSLIEVLISLTILAVGLLGLALMQTTAIKGNEIANKSTVATELAQDTLERFRRIAWENVLSQANPTAFNTTPTPIYTSLPAAAGDNVTVRGTTYYRIWRVDPNVATATLKTITVWSCWQDDRGGWHSVMLVAQRSSVGV